LHFIGKESNLLEQVEEGAVHDPQSAYTEYPDAQREREAWLQDTVPKLRAIPLGICGRSKAPARNLST
jgi:hypothetical protein